MLFRQRMIAAPSYRIPFHNPCGQDWMPSAISRESVILYKVRGPLASRKASTPIKYSKSSDEEIL